MNLHDNRYVCPSCSGDLKVNTKLIFGVKRPDGTNGMLLMEPGLGDYRVITHPLFMVKEKEQLSFYCPMCHNDLEAKSIDSHLVKILMITEDGAEHTILFSRIHGEKCTYKISDKKVEAYGEDSDHYTNFWGEGPRY